MLLTFVHHLPLILIRRLVIITIVFASPSPPRPLPIIPSPIVSSPLTA